MVKRFLLRFASLVVIFDFWVPSLVNAHLLNMTEVELRINSNSEIEMTLIIDLLRSTDTAENYYQLALNPDSDEHKEIWSRLQDAIELRQGEKILPLDLKKAVPQETPQLADFENPFTWPRMKVSLTAGLLKRVTETPIKVTFLRSFIFEEPIVLTLIDDLSDLHMSRWLITEQPSPFFVPHKFNSASGHLELTSPIFKDATVMGIFHIIPDGIDHLLFLLALVLVMRGAKDLFLAVLLFTLAHSISLLLTTYSVIELPGFAVELAILFTIFFTGALALLGHSLKHSAVLVILFGLVHGLGFANAFRDYVILEGDFLWRLIGFNLGIEIAQLTFVVCALLARQCLNLSPEREVNVTRALAVVLMLLPSWWALSIFK